MSVAREGAILTGVHHAWVPQGLESETWESTNPDYRNSRYILLSMTRGLIRYQQTGQFHFITFSCYHRLPYLGRADVRDLFESSFERMRRKYKFVVAGYVVMPEHVHLLVSEPQNNALDRALQALKISVAVR